MSAQQSVLDAITMHPGVHRHITRSDGSFVWTREDLLRQSPRWWWRFVPGKRAAWSAIRIDLMMLACLVEDGQIDLGEPTIDFLVWRTVETGSWKFLKDAVDATASAEISRPVPVIA